MVTHALRERSKASLKSLIKNCGDLNLVQTLVSEVTPPEILRHVLAEFGAKLGADVAAKRSFVTSGGLQRLQVVLKTHTKGVEAGHFCSTWSHYSPFQLNLRSTLECTRGI